MILDIAIWLFIFQKFWINLLNTIVIFMSNDPFVPTNPIHRFTFVSEEVPPKVYHVMSTDLKEATKTFKKAWKRNNGTPRITSVRESKSHLDNPNDWK